MMKLTTAFVMIFMAASPGAVPGGAHAQDGAAPAATAEAVAQPGDVVKITIWREPDLSQEITVPPSGRAIFPKIGERVIGGRTTAEIEQDLRTEYARYLINPSIQIEILRKVQILGAVHRPGVYPLDPTVSLADAIAIAGGTTPNGQPNRVELRRGGETIEVLVADGGIADSAIMSGDQLFVPERSFLERNSSSLAIVMSSAIGVLVTLLVR